MKTAIKICLAVLVGMSLSHAAPVFAQGLAEVALANAGPSSGAMTQPVPKAVVLPKVDTPSVGAPATPSSIVPASFPPAFEGGKEKGGKEEMSAPKVPDSVKGVIKRLNTATENVTLEDLNSAREAVAKLDILIDIEKRLTDLASLRQEREEKSLANAIPASALGSRGAAPGLPSFSPTPGGSPQAVYIPPPPPVNEIQRIVGAGGHYTALIKSGDGKSTLVHEGDKMPDGSVVQSITAHGVTIIKNKTTRTLQVKDVAVVFNGR